MKLIGLLGGTSWPSTMQYYEELNRRAQAECGGHHSARIMLYSIDYHAIKSRYKDGWNEIPDLLEQEIRFFIERKPDCLVIANNTLHRAFDQVQQRLALSIPVFHAGHLSAEEARRQEYKKILLLATKFTMEDGFFARYLEQRGAQVLIPNEAERMQIQEIQSELAKGRVKPEFGAALAAIVRRYSDADVVVLACTELPLALNEKNSPLPIINPILSQCRAAAEFAFELSMKPAPCVRPVQVLEGMRHG